MVIDKIVHGKNLAIRDPKKRVPCSVEGCPKYGRLGWYQVIGYTHFGNYAMRFVLFLCEKHSKEFHERI